MMKCHLRAQWSAFLACLLTGVLLSACATDSSHVAHFYLLTPVETTVPVVSGQPPISLLVGPVEVPQYLNRAQIVTQSGPNELDMAEYDRWGDNFKKNLTRVLAENLAKQWPTERVFMAGTPNVGVTDFRVEVEIIRFERGVDQRVHLTARWYISQGEQYKGDMAHLTELTSPQVAAADYPAIVAAMSGLIGELGRAITNELRVLAKSLPKPKPPGSRG